MMVDEYSKPPHNKQFSIPDSYHLDSLKDKMEKHYTALFKELSTQMGVWGQMLKPILMGCGAILLTMIES